MVYYARIIGIVALAVLFGYRHPWSIFLWFIAIIITAGVITMLHAQDLAEGNDWKWCPVCAYDAFWHDLFCHWLKLEECQAPDCEKNK